MSFKRNTIFTLIGILIFCLQIQDVFADSREIPGSLKNADYFETVVLNLENDPVESSQTYPGNATAIEKETDSSECEDAFLASDWSYSSSIHYFSALVNFRPGNFLEENTPPPKI